MTSFVAAGAPMAASFVLLVAGVGEVHPDTRGNL